MRLSKSVWVAPLLILICVFLLQASVPNIPTGTWQAWSEMSSPRAGAASPLLPDGRVLISGGADAQGPTSSAEFFGTDAVFSAGPSMRAARFAHTATLLQDGRVLVAGGANGNGVTNTAEVYDPTTNSWNALSATLADARAGHTATLLADGRVLLAGGHDSTGNPLSSVEVFDPLNDSFGFVGAMSSPRMNHAAAMLADGRVLLVGGTDGANALASVDIYNPIAGTVVPGPALAMPRMSASATTTLGGNVVVIGGNDGTKDLNSIEIYDSANGHFTTSASTLLTSRNSHTAFLLPNNNSVLVVGGSSSGTDLNSSEIYYPWADATQGSGSMTVARPGMTGSTVKQDGLLLVAGGNSLSSTELYGFATVKTDKDDYAPGEIVTITGSGWQPGETVTLTLVESPNFDTHPVLTAVADGNGNIYNTQFSPDQHDIGIRFYLTAVGSQSQAQTVFTDAVTLQSISVGAQNPGAIKSGASATYNPLTLTFSGNGSTGCNVTLSATGLPTGASAVFGTNPIASTGATTTTTLTINTTAATPAGTTTFTVQGTAPSVSGGNGCNGATRSTTATLVVDNTSPSVTINQAAGQADPTNTSPINFTVVFNEPVSNFSTGDVTLGGSAGATTATVTGSGTTYNVAVTGMTGSGTVNATVLAGVATDTAGNPNLASTSSDNSVTYDVTLPASPSTPDLEPSSDTGALDTDNITSMRKPTFTGTESENGTTVTLLVDGVANGSTVVSGGSWTITALNNISDGTHSITATSTDAAGNVSAPSGALSVTVDTVANAPSTPDLDPASDSGSLNTDNITSVATPQFNGTAEAGATVQLFRGGGISVGTTTADSSGNWSFTLGTALSDGTYSITGKQTDVAGNVSPASAALSVTIDTAPPSAPSSPNLSPSDDTGILNSDNITNKTTNLNLAGTADPAVTVTLLEGSTPLGTTTANNGSGNWNVTAAGPFAEGSHVFTAKATDTAGNNSAVSTPHTVLIDTTVPSVTINQAAGQSDPAAAGPINFTVIFSESTTNFTTGDVSLAGTAGATTAVVTGSGTTYNVAVSGMTSPGTVIALVNAGVETDTAGNGNAASTTTDNTVTYNPDSKPPIVTVAFAAPDGQNGWFVHSAVAGTVSADDSTTGNSNVTAITCLQDGSPLAVGSLTGVGTQSASGTINALGDGTHNISCTATDSAGNTGAFTGSTVMPVVIKIDTQAPTGVAGAADRVPDHNGWYNHSVTISFNGSDTTSGIATCTSTSYSGSDNAAATVSGHCADNAGNTSPDVAFDFKFDATPPTAASSVSAGTAGANGWYTSDVTVHTTGADDVSDPMTCTTDQFQTAETAGQAFNGSCTNDAGLTTNAAALIVKLDKTGPTASLAVKSGTLGLNGWYTSDVVIDTTGTDSISSPVSCTADQTLNTDSSGTLFHGSCTNDAGLTTNASDLSVKRDATPPVLALAFTPDLPDGTNGWWKTPGGVPFSWTCSDAASGIDAGYNGGCPSPSTGAVTANGTTPFAAQVRDQAGNLSVQVSRDLKLDNVAPVVTWNHAGDSCSLPGNSGWCRGTQTASFTASDATSGLANSLQAAFNQSTAVNGSAIAISSGAVTDLAGNTSAGVNAGPYKIDSVAPTASIISPANSGSYVLNASVAANYSCDDVTSGIATCAGPVASGANFSTNPVGAHTFTVTATDVAGNSAPVTNNYSVSYASGGMCLGSPGHAILQPINPDGSSVFKQKSTVPGKFRVCDALGNSLGTPGVVSSFRLIRTISGTSTDVDEAVDSTTPDNAFRWDPTGQQWIFNMSTKSLSANVTYAYRIVLNDGSNIDFAFGLK